MYEYTQEETPKVAGVSLHIPHASSTGSFEKDWRRRQRARYQETRITAWIVLAASVCAFFYIGLACFGSYSPNSAMAGVFVVASALAGFAGLFGVVGSLSVLFAGSDNTETLEFRDSLPLPGRQFLEALTRIQTAGNRLSPEETEALTAYLCALQRTGTLSLVSGERILELADRLEDIVAGNALRSGCPQAEQTPNFETSVSTRHTPDTRK